MIQKIDIHYRGMVLSKWIYCFSDLLCLHLNERAWYTSVDENSLFVSLG